MILVGFRHGLRVSELCDLQWSSIAFETGTMYVHRAKGGDQGQQFARLWLCKASRKSFGRVQLACPHDRIADGQVRELLDFLALTSSFEGFATRPTAASYS